MKFIVISILTFIISHTILSAQTMLRTELLGRPTDHSITVNIMFDSTTEVRANWYSGQDKPISTQWIIALGNQPTDVLIDGLSSNKEYKYFLQYRNPKDTNAIKTRPEYTFKTQKPAGTSFTFVVQADPHLDVQSDTNIYTLCLQNQLLDKPDFMIDLGDILMTDKLTNTAKQVPFDTIPFRCNLLRKYYEMNCHSVPLFIALGNHEGEALWNIKNNNLNSFPIWATNERKKYFLNPAPDDFYSGDTTNHPNIGLRENYYAFSWGDAKFIVLDPYWYTTIKPDSLNGWRWTLGKDQYEWLKKTLEQNTSTYTFVFAHQLVGGSPEGRGGIEYANLYEWGGNNIDGTRGFEKNRPGWSKPIKDLFKEHKVHVFFHGHDHFFCKQEKDCLVYQETPQPSHPNFSSVNYADDYGYFAGEILPNSGHLRIHVSPESVQVEYVRTYLPKNENSTRKNRDVSSTYTIAMKNCYDTLTTSVPMIYNTAYADEKVFPNPFSEQSTIQFNLEKTDILTISIIDEKGIIIRELAHDAIIQSGSFAVQWDGKDTIGNKLPSGSYSYIIKSKYGPTMSGRIVLVN